MKRTPETFEKIEAYLSQSLSQEEQKIFEEEMAKNIDLQQEVQKHKSLNAILEDKDTIAFKEKLIEINKKIKENDTSRSFPFFSPFLKIAATLLILVAIGSLFWYTTDSKDKTQQLYASYYEPFPVEDVTRGETINLHRQTIKNYRNQNYTQVIEALENITDLTDEFILYLGNSYLNTNQELKAIAEFKKIKTNSRYYENARWYLSLTYLKMKNIKSTISLLEEIIAYNGIYKNEAIILKEALQH